MNWLIGTTAAIAIVLGMAFIEGPNDAQAAQASAMAEQDAQQQAQQDAAADAREKRISHALATGQAQLARIDTAMALGKPEGMSDRDWQAAQRAVDVAMGRK